MQSIVQQYRSRYARELMARINQLRIEARKDNRAIESITLSRSALELLSQDLKMVTGEEPNSLAAVMSIYGIPINSIDDDIGVSYKE